VCLKSFFRWRHRCLAAARDKRPSVVSGIVEADETFILKSSKGSRKIAGRKPRKCGGNAWKPGLSTDEHDCVPLVRDRHAATADHILPDPDGATFRAHLTPVVVKDAALVGDRRQACAHFADAAGITHVTCIAAHGERVLERDGDRHTPRYVAEALGG
jgi:hypothetical protein